MRMIRLLLSAVLLTGHAAATEPPRWRSIKMLPDYADAQAQLQALVDIKGRASINRLCVVGERADGFYDAWVYWPTRNSLVFWSANRDNPQAIVDSRIYLNLSRDVIADNAVDTSSYRQRRSYVNSIIKACRRFGDQWVVTKSTGRRHHD